MRRKGIAWLFSGILLVAGITGIEYRAGASTTSDALCRCAPTYTVDASCIQKTGSIQGC